MLSAGVPARVEIAPAMAAFLLVYTAVYTLLWTLRARVLVRQAARLPALLLADVVLSLVAVWLGGGSGGPLIPFAWGALVFPGLLFRWRGALVAYIAYLLLDLGGAALFPRLFSTLDAVALFSAFRYLGAAAVAAAPLLLGMWKPRTSWGRPRVEPVHPRSAALSRSYLSRPAEMRSAVVRREARAGSATAVRLAEILPQTLARPPLVAAHAAVRQAVAEAEEHGMAVQLVIEGAEPVVPADQVQLMAKAVDEALANIRQHAQTSEAEVSLTRERAGLVLTIRDHGLGLLDGTAEPPGFHQLKCLRYRLEEIEGSLDVSDAEGGGVIVTVRIPGPALPGS